MTARIPQSWRSIGWALLGMALGLGMIVGGFQAAFATEPSCGGAAMEPDDLCRHWDPDLGYDSGYDVEADDELRSERIFGTAAVVIGTGALVGVGIAWWRRSRRGEFHERSVRPPTAPTHRAGPVGTPIARSLPGATATPQRAATPAGEDPMRPIVLRRQKRGIMLTADRQGIGVEFRRPRAPEGAPWRTVVRLNWGEIEALEFDSDRYDSPIALYAVLRGARPRAHLIDAQRFSRAAWARLAARIPVLSRGTVTLDLTGIGDPGPDRFT